MRWPARNGQDGTAGGGPDGSQAQSRALDWRAVLTRLAPVRHRWDLAILCNLREDTGCRPADLLAAINVQSGAGRQLSPQVLSGRLRMLEHDGYVRHEDLSVMPLHRAYYLQPLGQALLADLSRIALTPRPVFGAAITAEESPVSGA